MLYDESVDCADRLCIKNVVSHCSYLSVKGSQTISFMLEQLIDTERRGPDRPEGRPSPLTAGTLRGRGGPPDHPADLGTRCRSAIPVAAATATIYPKCSPPRRCPA